LIPLRVITPLGLWRVVDSGIALNDFMKMWSSAY
jgi:hypothetical protein